MFQHAEGARSRGIKVIIAGAGGAAHLPGMVAAKTTLPVIGVPVKSRAQWSGLALFDCADARRCACGNYGNR